MCGIISSVKINPFFWVLFCLLLSLCERHLMSKERQLWHHALCLSGASCNALFILLAHKAPAMQPTTYYDFKNKTCGFSQNLILDSILYITQYTKVHLTLWHYCPLSPDLLHSLWCFLWHISNHQVTAQIGNAWKSLQSRLFSKEQLHK